MQNNKIENLTITSSLSDIARDIAYQYLYRAYTEKKMEQGLLDYTKIRQQKISTDVLHRPLHGYPNAVRLAWLFCLMTHFCKKHMGAFPYYIQIQIERITERWIKNHQMVALLRTAGRSKDDGRGHTFRHQSQKECENYLQKLGYAQFDAEDLSMLLVGMEEDHNIGKRGSLALCLLSDAAMLESFRDTTSQKHIKFSDFTLVKLMAPNSREALNDFRILCSHHANVIKSQQGFIYHALKDDQGNSLKNWPELNPPNLNLYIEKLHTIQKIFEYQPNCFEICESEIYTKGCKILDQSVNKKTPSTISEPSNKIILPFFREHREKKCEDKQTLQWNRESIDLMKMVSKGMRQRARLGAPEIQILNVVDKCIEDLDSKISNNFYDPDYLMHIRDQILPRLHQLQLMESHENNNSSSYRSGRG